MQRRKRLSAFVMFALLVSFPVIRSWQLFPRHPARARCRKSLRSLDCHTVTLCVAFDLEGLFVPKLDTALPLPPAAGRAFLVGQVHFLHSGLLRLPFHRQPNLQRAEAEERKSAPSMPSVCGTAKRHGKKASRKRAMARFHALFFPFELGGFQTEENILNIVPDSSSSNEIIIPDSGSIRNGGIRLAEGFAIAPPIIYSRIPAQILRHPCLRW